MIYCDNQFILWDIRHRSYEPGETRLSVLSDPDVEIKNEARMAVARLSGGPGQW
jgi:hypothetical protein